MPGLALFTYLNSTQGLGGTWQFDFESHALTKARQGCTRCSCKLCPQTSVARQGCTRCRYPFSKGGEREREREKERHKHRSRHRIFVPPPSVLELECMFSPLSMLRETQSICFCLLVAIDTRNVVSFCVAIGVPVYAPSTVPQGLAGLCVLLDLSSHGEKKLS